MNQQITNIKIVVEYENGDTTFAEVKDPREMFLRLEREMEETETNDPLRFKTRIPTITEWHLNIISDSPPDIFSTNNQLRGRLKRRKEDILQD